MKKILVTGAAGFIGFHLSLFLKERKDEIIGFDNFHPYYDPKLKIDRKNFLEERDIPIIYGDVNDTEKLIELIKKYSITHIVHLAAQAGIREANKKIKDYIHSNLAGFISLLEACKHFSSLRVIYASSSSVYGLNTKIPFTTSDRTDTPANLYGATKKANELIAHAYHHLYGIPLIGLRYFTVYGPWGRPDMAYYLFTKQMMEKTPIDVFNFGNMKRDFTYIDDIVKGTAAAIDLETSFDIFNLGNNHPISLLELVEQLEKTLGIKAIKNLLSSPGGEILETYADIAKSQKKLNYFPRVSLKEGIEKFTKWYLWYHQRIN